MWLLVFVLEALILFYSFLGGVSVALRASSRADKAVVLASVLLWRPAVLGDAEYGAG